jgi:uncharacterized coiled-coil protein SlyX
MAELEQQIEELKLELSEKDKTIESLEEEIRDTRDAINNIVYDLNKLT